MLYKRKGKLLLAAAAGGTLGFIGQNIPGAVIGASLAYKAADLVLDPNGNNIGTVNAAKKLIEEGRTYYSY